jgi:hypothetical protein
MILELAAAMTILPGSAGPVTGKTSEAELVKELGPARVKQADIHVGEGFMEPGTLIDGNDPARALAILWRDPKTRLAPSAVHICYGLRAGACLWRTDDGISNGTSLKKLEALHRRPFQLMGFAWDYEGTVMNWSGGALERWAGTVRLFLRLRPDPERTSWPEWRQVQGDREYSSAHPAMQKLNPTVYQMILHFKTP